MHSEPLIPHPGRHQRILLVGPVIDLFRDALYLALDTRPTWFFEVAPSAEAAARMLDDHDVDAIVAAISREGGVVLAVAVEDHPTARRVAVVARHRFPHPNGTQHDATIDARASAAEQVATLEQVLAPPKYRQSA